MDFLPSTDEKILLTYMPEEARLSDAHLFVHNSLTGDVEEVEILRDGLCMLKKQLERKFLVFLYGDA